MQLERKDVPGEENLQILLENMAPVLSDEEYVFITLNGSYGDYRHLEPLCSYKEKEGLSLVVPRKLAEANGIDVDGIFKVITLEVHSSLNAVGLTAAVASKLSSAGISANVIAAYYHDHILVQAEHADQALSALKELVSIRQDTSPRTVK